MGKENGGGNFRMTFRYLRVPAFLVLAFSISSYAQSLGDVARQLRAERQQSEHSNRKVITNDDIVSPDSRRNATQSTTAENIAKGEPGKEGEEAASSTAESTGAKVKKDPAKEHEAQAVALDKRSEEINRVYLDRIAAIRTQISTAQQELAKLQVAQVESTNSYRRTLGVSPNVGTYAEEQRLFTEQIEAHRDLINSLSSQLEDAEEAARHAGVPHAERLTVFYRSAFSASLFWICNR